MNLHQRFGQRLEDLVSNWTSTDTKIGQLFIDFGTEFTDIYKKYIEGYAISRKQFTSELKSIPEFLVFVEEKKREFKWKVDDLLVLPVQRTTRYHLLLKDLFKETDEDHVDRASLQLGYYPIFFI